MNILKVEQYSSHTKIMLDYLNLQYKGGMCNFGDTLYEKADRQNFREKTFSCSLIAQ